MYSRPFKIQRRIDRISELPDPILCKILRLLPTKNAFAATILSTRWKNLFPIWDLSTPVTLDLDDSDRFRPGWEDSSFVNFVDKLFNELLRDVHCLDTMTLKCKNECGDGKILSWLSAAARLHVRELRLDFYFQRESIYTKQTKLKTLSLCGIWFCYLDPSMMTALSDGCPELEELSLIHCDSSDRFKLDVWIKFPRLKTLIIRNSSNKFTSYKFTIETPELKTLDLCNVMFLGESECWHSMSLITGFPVLEELFLTDCFWQYVNEITIESSLLRSLIIRERERGFSSFKLNTPNLQLLLLDGPVTYYKFICPLNSLRSTHIDVGPGEVGSDCDEMDFYEEKEPFYFEHVRDLVRCGCDTRHLYLATRSIELLGHILVDLPTFQNLTSLKLGCLCPSGWKVLERLLCNAPYLEKLVFEKGFEQCKGGYAEFESAVSSSTTPVFVKFNLKEINFLEFNDLKDGFKLIKYLLKNSEVLQRLKIHFLPIKNSSSLKTLLKLSMNPKIVITFACWKDKMLLKDEMLLKEIGSRAL